MTDTGNQDARDYISAPVHRGNRGVLDVVGLEMISPELRQTVDYRLHGEWELTLVCEKTRRYQHTIRTRKAVCTKADVSGPKRSRGKMGGRGEVRCYGG